LFALPLPFFFSSYVTMGSPSEALTRRRRSKSELTIPKRALATTIEGEGEKERQEAQGRGRETSASPSHKTRSARCEKRRMRTLSVLSAGEGAAAWAEG
jgi:hypothetical protein